MIATYIWGESMKNSSKLFSPTVYADGQLFNSLGAVMVTSLLIIFFVGVLVRDQKRHIQKDSGQGTQDARSWLYAGAILLMIAGVFLYVT